MTDEQLDEKCEEFYAAMLASNLPFAAIYASGGPSIHGLVRVDAKDDAEWRERMEVIYEFCATMPGFDKSNKNASRLSRLPGAMRDESKQELLCWRAGAPTYEEWRESVEEHLFEIEDPLEWTEEQIALPPPILIDGWLHKGHLGMLTGSMKTNKSWTLLELAICFATGVECFGLKCRESAVLYIDAEIQRPFWRQRAVSVCRQRDLEYEGVMRKRLIRPAFVAGRNPNASELKHELERLFERGAMNDVDLIIIDPMYQFYEEAWDENGNSDMAKLGKILRSIAELTGISILFAHHHSKGSQEGKRDIEKASGGGAFGRFVASSLAITLIDEETHKYTLGWTTTHFPPSPKQVAYREEFQWRITDEDPKEAVRNHRTVDQIMAALPDDGATSDVWLEACREEFEISDDAFKTLRSNARRTERIHFTKIDNKWKPTVSELEARKSTLATSNDDMYDGAQHI
jgi:RecA-family ATPase